MENRKALAHQHRGRSSASIRKRVESVKPKIENVKINGIRRTGSTFHEFIEVLKELEVGQSFTYDLKSNHRLAIQIAQHLLDRRFACRAEKATFRVGRLT
jgi:hypothetical protein